MAARLVYVPQWEEERASEGGRYYRTSLSVLSDCGRHCELMDDHATVSGSRDWITRCAGAVAVFGVGVGVGVWG